MKRFFRILRFELKNYLTNKVFVGVTVFLMVALMAVMFFPRLSESFSKPEDTETSYEERPRMSLAGLDEAEAATVLQAFSAAFSEYEVALFDQDIQTLTEQIRKDEIACAFVFDGLTSYTYYVDDLSMYDSGAVLADELLREIYRMTAMIDSGIPAEEAGQIMSATISHEVQILGKDQMNNYFYTYIMIMALYMVT